MQLFFTQTNWTWLWLKLNVRVRRCNWDSHRAEAGSEKPHMEKECHSKLVRLKSISLRFNSPVLMEYNSCCSVYCHCSEVWCHLLLSEEPGTMTHLFCISTWNALPRWAHNMQDVDVWSDVYLMWCESTATDGSGAMGHTLIQTSED